MRRWSSLPRPLVAALAALFAAAAILYGFLWMYDARHPDNPSRNSVAPARPMT